MDWDQLERRWQDFAGSARARWNRLTDGDWQSISGKKEQLAERIQERYGIAKEKAGEQVDEWSRGLLDIVEAPKTH